MSILDAALAWHEAGCFVLPVRADGTKAPAVGQWDAARGAGTQDVDDILELFEYAGPVDGVGLVCGSPSGQLEMLEVEGRAIEQVRELEQLVKRHGLTEVWDALHGYVEATPSGGIHWLFRAEGPAKPNTKLARRPRHDGPGADVTWETRGQGGFVVVAPSGGRTHPTGRSWLCVGGNPSTVPTITTDERNLLYQLIREFLDEMPEVQREPSIAFTRSHMLGADETGERPGDDFNVRGDWRQILDGWTVVRRMGSGIAWRRPGKDTPGISATTGMRDDADRLYVFSSSAAPFEPEVPYTKFGAYALLYHHGDHAAAAAELRRLGYGADRPRPADDWSDIVAGGLPPFVPELSSGDALFADAGSALPARDESQTLTTESSHWSARIRDGGSFLFDHPPNPVPVWGDGPEILWSQGEPCIITGPIGAGKTTVLGQLVKASLGLASAVLNYPVLETDVVLYLASDRPRQIARNLRRMFDPDDRAELERRLKVWPGPPPLDVAKNPAILLELAQAAGATRVFVDGIKDIAAKIGEEETGQGLNRAFQLLVADGIDVVANHHQRKAAGAGMTRPKSLDDVYGSTWISAGAGTVLLVWVDEAGSDAVELSTLKPAAEHVGPVKLIHDADLGTLEREPQDPNDPEQPPTTDNVSRVLRESRGTTLTAKEVLVRGLKWHENKVDKAKIRNARRSAQTLAKRGVVEIHEMPNPHGGSAEQHYQWVGP